MKSRFIFKVMYLGSRYQGYQRQLNGRSIENFLELAFIKSGHIRSFGGAEYKGTSRTDSSVHALSNVFALNLTKKPHLEAINYFLPDDIIVHEYARVPLEFDPRKNISKVYSYFIPKGMELYSPERIYDCIGTHNFKSFIKKDGAGADNPVNQIFEIKLVDHRDYTQIKMRGNRFGREQIRRMVGILLQEKFREMSISELLDTGNILDITSAPPHFLFLEEITYMEDLDWQRSSNIVRFISNFIQLNKIKSKQKFTIFNIINSIYSKILM